MTEKEYIERDAAYKACETYFSGVCVYDVSESEVINDFEKVIDAVPTTDVIPIRHGHWIAEENWTPDDYYYTCSICREDFYMIVGTPSDNNYKYCPNCGAKMDGNEVE